MKIYFAAGLALMAVILFQGCTEDRADTQKLLGKYQLVRGDKGGQEIPADRLKDVTVHIAANAITTFDKDKKEVYAATYQIDPTQQPWRITMTATLTPVDGKGTKAEGLIKREGDTVKLIYALPGGKAPTDFKCEEKQQMFVLKRLGD